jgi:hypothetical protein
MSSDLDYKIAIPSYKRHETLRDSTIQVLMDAKIPKERIFIFVADESEKKLYQDTLPLYYNEIVVGEPGMGAIRRFIQQYFNEGDYVVNLDDDIRDLYYLNSKGKLTPIKDKLEDAIVKAFQLCLSTGSRLWGIYPVKNAFFMSQKVSVGFYYIVGAFWGVINTKNPELSVTLDDKEDFERTIKFYLKYGRVIRLDFITLDTRYYTEKGGMQEERTEERVIKSAKYLLKKYPLLCERNKARKNHFEIKLRDRR